MEKIKIIESITLWRREETEREDKEREGKYTIRTLLKNDYS
jgi:hypothetical protein